MCFVVVGEIIRMFNLLKSGIKILCAVVSFFAMMIMLGLLTAEHYFPDATLNQIVFHALYIDREQLSYYLLEIAGAFFISLLLAVMVYKRLYFMFLVFAMFYYMSGNPLKVSDIEVDKKISLGKQMRLSLEWSLLYEKYYKISALKEPENKKNIIVIFAESMEDNFADEKYFGENLIPNLTKLKKEGVSFTGYKSINGTNWTLASNVATFCGVPIRTQLRDRLGPDTKKFLPNAICLPDMLHELGYYNVFSTGTYLSFVGTDVFVKEHHFDEVYGRDELIEQNYADKKDIGMEEYGINDAKLLEYARQKIGELVTKNKPFFFSLQTTDTHFPHGYVQPFCEVKYGDTSDAIKCSDKIIYDFVKWCQNQDFYANTIIVIVGDHLMMSASDLAEKTENYPHREIYNVILSQDVKPQIINKPYAMFDWAATIADKTGITDGVNLGLGVSLLSDKPTLVQSKGEKSLEESILKNSVKYNKLLGIWD